MTGDFSEIYKSLIAALEADGTLTAMLGDSTQIYQDWPDLAPKWPALILKINGKRPVVSLDAVGLWWPNLQIDVLGLDPVVIAGIEARINTLLDIPRTVSQPIVGTNFSITEMYLLDSQEMGSFQWANTDQQAKRLAMLWRMRVRSNSG